MKTIKNMTESYETPMVNVLLVKMAAIIANSNGSGEDPEEGEPE